MKYKYIMILSIVLLYVLYKYSAKKNFKYEELDYNTYAFLVKNGFVNNDEELAPKIILIFDYTCKYCALLNEKFKLIKERLHFNLPIVYYFRAQIKYSQGYEDANAALCAGAQAKFQDAHNLLFKYHHKNNLTYWEDFSKKIDLPNKNAFLSCVKNYKYAQVINNHMEISDSLKFYSTPVLSVGRRLYRKIPPFDELLTILKETYGMKRGKG